MKSNTEVLLSGALAGLLHVVVQEHVVGVVDLLHEGRGGRQQLEAHEHEGAEQHGAVRPALEHADDATGN